MPTQARTKSGTSRLSDLARHVVVPKGVTSTAWPSVRDKCRELGVEFDPWQDGAGRIILAKRKDGTYAASIGGVVISIPRQVGKTYLIGAIIFAMCLLNPGMTVIWTAHRARTAGETFQSMQGMARRKAIKPHVLKIVLGSGEEEVRFRNGSRIMFGARERGFGRGMAEVDLLVFDEGQILSDRAVSDMVPATNQGKNPLVFYVGTPPRPGDPSEVFRRKRTRAIQGLSTDTAYIEFSADQGADPMDRKQWAKANPSYPKRTPAESMLRMIDNLTPEDVLLEMLGIWDDGSDAPLIFPSWPDRVGEPTTPEVFAVAADVEQKWLFLGAVGGHHVGVVTPMALDVARVPMEHRTEFVAEVARIARAHNDARVALQVKGPAWPLRVPLEEAGVTVEPVDFEGFVQGCADIQTAVTDATLTHADDPDLNTAVRSAQWRAVGDRLVLSRKSGDIAALEAVVLARHAATQVKPTREFWGAIE